MCSQHIGGNLITRRPSILLQVTNGQRVPAKHATKAPCGGRLRQCVACANLWLLWPFAASFEDGAPFLPGAGRQGAGDLESFTAIGGRASKITPNHPRGTLTGLR